MSELKSHRRLAFATLVLVALAAVFGWAASFVGLHDYGTGRMDGFNDETAWLIPAAIDGAAFACSLVTYRASVKGRGAVRGRVLMWAFTAASSWINWVHQSHPEAQVVAAGLPVAAVAVFDVVLIELRADHEERSGKKAFRLRPGLLLLRYLVNRETTSAAFRSQIESIPVSALAGLGLTEYATAASGATPESPSATPAASVAAPEPESATSAVTDRRDVAPVFATPATPTVEAVTPGATPAAPMFMQVTGDNAASGATPERDAANAGATPESPSATPAASVAASEPESATSAVTDRRDVAPVFATPVAPAAPATPAEAPESENAASEVADFTERAAQTNVMPVIDRDTTADELAAMSSAAERIRYAASVLDHCRPSEIVSWLAGYGYEVNTSNTRAVLTRYRKQADARRSVVRLDGRRHAK